MQIFKTQPFVKWAKKDKLTDEALCKAISEMNSGLVDVKLGEGIYKKRIAIPRQGKSGGFRTILAFKMNDKAFFVFGFSKRKLANVSRSELG